MSSRPASTARDLGEVINALPSMFGFPPQDSFVALGLDGKTISFAMRFDLRDLTDVVDAARQVVRQLEKQRAGGAIVLSVGDPIDLGRKVVLAVEALLFARWEWGDETAVAPIVGGWATDDRFWVTLDGADDAGYAYTRTLDHPTSLMAIAAGQEIVGSRAALVAKLEPVAGPRRRRLDRMAPQAAKTHRARDDNALSDHVLPLIHDLFAERRVDDRDVLAVGYAMTRPGVQASALRLLTPDNARDMVRVWVHVARTVPVRWSPASLSLVAHAAWLRGDGAFAVTAAERAIEIDPRCVMAVGLRDLAVSGVSPREWFGEQRGS